MVNKSRKIRFDVWEAVPVEKENELFTMGAHQTPIIAHGRK